jgi:hypothetical protein
MERQERIKDMGDGIDLKEGIYFKKPGNMNMRLYDLEKLRASRARAADLKRKGPFE